MLRAFLGLSLAPSVTDRLVPICCGLADCRWVAARNMHITLAFMGDIDEGQAEDLDRVLAELPFVPFQLKLEGLGVFDNRGQPHSLWAGVTGDVGALAHLQRKVLSALHQVDIAHDGRKYKPHVTLGRLKGTPAEKVASFMAQHTPLPEVAFGVEGFHFYRSHLGKSGAEYEILRSYP